MSKAKSSVTSQLVFSFPRRVIILTTFIDLSISPDIVRAMNEMGWTTPTPVQIAAIPEGLKGGDMFAQAQTGTGKTGTYGTIMLSRIRPRMRAPSALVLVPTRELATQVSEELCKLSRFTGHVCTPIYGGVGIGPQADRLNKGVDIVVATPGRAKDLIGRGDLDLSKVSLVVLDEADRMLDMGFARDLDHILSKVPKKRQTLLFSATMSPDIKKLALRQMVDPQELLVSKDEPVLDLTRQHYLIAEKDVKRDALCTLLDQDDAKTIVFCHTRRRVDQLTKKLLACQYQAGAMHGDVAQNKRERIIRSFKDGSLRVLVATDVAARGLDIDAVDRVINFDAPDEPDTYVHRIGRTGRAGKEGAAVSLFLPEEQGMIKEIERHTGKPIAPMDLTIVHRPEMAPKPPLSSRPVAPRSTPLARSGARTSARGSIRLNVGNKDGLSKAEVVKMVRVRSRLSPGDMGRITVGDRCTYVEIVGKDAGKVTSEISGYLFRGKAVEAQVL